jgi:hypothetical protein
MFGDYIIPCFDLDLKLNDRRKARFTPDIVDRELANLLDGLAKMLHVDKD